MSISGPSVRYLNGASPWASIAEDVRRGLTGFPKSLPPKYFYDARGVALFEEITRLPEYYLTRAEQGLISRFGKELLAHSRPSEVLELGPGSIAKISSLLAASNGANGPMRYTALDVSEEVVREVVDGVSREYPSLNVHGLVGDFEKDLPGLSPASGRRLIAFLGSTIGNLDPNARRDFLSQVSRQMSPGDSLLLGVDLIKDRDVMEAAYNDSLGVTAEFNRNILRVVNHAVGTDFEPQAFRHHAFYNDVESRIEMHLVPESRQTVVLPGIGITVTVEPGETVWTESSHKFTRQSASAMLEEAGLSVERWCADAEDRFALVLAGPEP